jgi:hypothetical protein
MPATFVCILCDKETSRMKRGKVTANYKFCSKECQKKYFKINNTVTKPCSHCGKSVTRFLSEVKKCSGNIFCNNSCAATYSNTHKTTGTRVSKLEKYLQEKLNILYPNLCLFNDKGTINSELDIYVPSLKLAFELNGIFHYEPIYGKEKLAQIQNNDQRKFQACLEHNIELVIIDSSQFKYFKQGNADKYLDIVVNIINDKVGSK